MQSDHRMLSDGTASGPAVARSEGNAVSRGIRIRRGDALESVVGTTTRRNLCNDPPAADFTETSS